MTNQTNAETKLTHLVKEKIAPSIKEFVKSLSDDEIVELLTKYKSMNIDLTTDLTNAVKERKIVSNKWTEDSPFDAFMEDGITD